jgi:prepilin-type N-terminal cleavage/methylation domain-containing protein
MRRRLAAEDGFSLIEVMIAALMLALIAAAAAALFSTGSGSSLASQRQNALLSVAEQQIEQIREAVKTQGFSSLAMSAPPAAGGSATLSYQSTNYTDPNHFVASASGCGSSSLGYTIEANYNNTSEGTATGTEPLFTNCPLGVEPLIIQSGGIVTPSQTVAYGAGTVTVDTYVTQTNLGCNTALGTGSCGNDSRRVILAVVPNPGGRFNNGPNAPLYLSTLFTNPTPSNAPNSSVGITLGAQLG